jgi:hypothetical protein
VRDQISVGGGSMRHTSKTLKRRGRPPIEDTSMFHQLTIRLSEDVWVGLEAIQKEMQKELNVPELPLGKVCRMLVAEAIEARRNRR